MATRIVIIHLKGAKNNQIEQFALDTSGDISIGRDSDSTIAFDRQPDDTVSPHHAVIRIVARGDRPAFRITDLGSSNGTLVNGARLSGEAELLPGDLVQLGTDGPQFSFDLLPRPGTRVEPLAGGMTAKQDAASTTILPKPPGPRPGQAPVMMFAAAVLLVIAAALGAVYYRYSGNQPSALVVTAKPERSAQPEMSPIDVAQKFGNATTFIDMQWRLYDKETGKRIFHKTVLWKTRGNSLPAYVKLPNGVIVRWLTTEDGNHMNEPIGADGTGSGFVVDSQGYILTNKHVAAGWKVEYGFKPYEANGGVLFQLDSNLKVANISEFDPTNSAALYHWIPDDGGIVFDNRSPIPLNASEHLFEGRDEQLDIRFPGQRVSYASRLIRASSDADVAEIRVDSIQKLPAVELEQEDGVRVGEHVTVLGYPGISEQTIATVVTNEVGRKDEHQELIPEPTVTDGLIAKIGTGEQKQNGITTSGTMGDVYQLTVLATGAGNSGGPVFNASGRVIGLFTYAKTHGAERVTFAVPIRYGRDLLSPQRVN